MSAYARENNMRLSLVRNMVLQRICQLPQPFTAEQLVEACQDIRVSVGTVYNLLRLFVLAHILHATSRQRGKTAVEYELMTGGPTIRMEVICQKCGRISEFHDPAIERMISDRKYTNFIAQHMTLFVYGECRICRTRTKKTKAK